MKAIPELQKAYVMSMAGMGTADACIDWAITRLEHDEEDRDQDVVSLAATNDKHEAIKHTETILNRYIGNTDPELIAGKHIVLLHQMQIEGQISVTQLDDIIGSLYCRLDYPSWLVMLSRNCEYATYIPDFMPAFQAEFDYISGLWSQANSLAEFLQVYDRMTSNSHDIVRA